MTRQVASAREETTRKVDKLRVHEGIIRPSLVDGAGIVPCPGAAGEQLLPGHRSAALGATSRRCASRSRTP